MKKQNTQQREHNQKAHKSGDRQNESIHHRTDKLPPTRTKASRTQGVTRLPTSNIFLSIPKARKGRRLWERPIDQHLSTRYGNSIQMKSPDSIRVFFQNVKGRTHTSGLEDSYYHVQRTIAHNIWHRRTGRDKHAWQHPHLQADFCKQLKKYFRQHRVTFGFPTMAIDKCSESTTYQPGGNLAMINGNPTLSHYSKQIEDPYGLGRWCGLILRGKGEFQVAAITAYRMCARNHRTAPFGSTYSREHQFFRDQGHQSPNPRQLFIQHLSME